VIQAASIIAPKVMHSALKISGFQEFFQAAGKSIRSGCTDNGATIGLSVT
jgi:hypothetical protein